MTQALDWLKIYLEEQAAKQQQPATGKNSGGSR